MGQGGSGQEGGGPMIRGRLRGLLSGDGLRARALRGTAFTFFGFGTQQFLRLLSNLVLTRLLFPEAFGLMALVMVVLTGLQMISDAGLNPSIVQSRRGDEPDFLNTAWSLQIGRGFLLWLLTLALALPLARFYDQPQLAALLPVAGFGMVIQGFQSMRLASANRHIALGRLTLMELGSQVIGIAVMVLLAWWLRSVWALVIGTLIGTAIKTVLSHRMLPGHRDRLGLGARRLLRDLPFRQIHLRRLDRRIPDQSTPTAPCWASSSPSPSWASTISASSWPRCRSWSASSWAAAC